MFSSLKECDSPCVLHPLQYFSGGLCLAISQVVSFLVVYVIIAIFTRSVEIQVQMGVKNLLSS